MNALPLTAAAGSFVATQPNGESYADHQRHDWESSVFAQMLDKAGPDTQGFRGETGSGRIPKFSNGSLSQDAGEAGGRVGSAMPILSGDVDPAARFADGRPGGTLTAEDPPMINRIIGQAVGTIDTSTSDTRVAEEGALDVVSASAPRAFGGLPLASLLPSDSVVVSYAENEDIRVAVRAPRLPTWQLPAFLSRLRTELSWLGMGLEHLQINGSTIFAAANPVLAAVRAQPDHHS